MAQDPRNEGWNHRSQFAHPSDPGAKTVTENYSRRVYGEFVDRDEERAMLLDVDLSDDDEDDESESERRLHERYDARHIPDSYEQPNEETDERSNREKLLAGETVSV